MSEQAFKEKYEHRVREIKYGEVDAFIAEMMADPLIDYGSVCLAIGYAAAAAAWAADRHPENGGITGFQSGFVMWEFLRQWQSSIIGESGTRIQNFDDLLYPQYGHKFTNTISTNGFVKLQELAKKNIDEKDEYAHPEVVAHWQSIVDGNLPFGFIIKED